MNKKHEKYPWPGCEDWADLDRLKSQRQKRDRRQHIKRRKRKQERKK